MMQDACNVCIVDYIAALHAACNGAVDNDGAHKVAHVGCLTTCCIYAHTHFAEFGKQFVGSVDDGRNDLARNEQLVAADGRRNKDVVCRTNAEEVVNVHYQCILCNSLPHTKVTGLFPVEIGQ